jgi:hypothetical protein
MEVIIRGKSGNIYNLPLENQERFLKILELNCSDYFMDTAGRSYQRDFHFEIMEARGIDIEEAKKIIIDSLNSLDSRFFTE